MAILVNCAGCGRQFRAKDQFRNTRLPCPKCRATVFVQGPHVCGSDVFISHSSHDKQVADAVCGALESKNLVCWVAPRDIPPGASWGSAIIEGIEDSRAMLLVFSAHANQSDQVLREVERAVAKRKPVVPLRIDREPMRKDFEYFLASCHWLDVTDGALEDHLAGLTKTMRHLLLDRAEVEADQRQAEPSAPAAPAVPATVTTTGTTGARRKRGVLRGVLFVVIAGAALYGLWHASPRHPGTANTQPAGATASAGADRPGEPAAIDLLARFRIPEDVVSGEWTRADNGGIHAAGQAPGRANFGEPPAGDYDLRVEFTPLIGEQGVGLILSRFGQNFAFGIAPNSDSGFAFGMEKGKPARRQQLTGEVGRLRNDTRCTVVIQVRRHGATAFVNGQRVAHLFTANFSELAVPRQWGIGRNALGLVTYRTLVVHSAECVPVPDGSDEPTAPPEP